MVYESDFYTTRRPYSSRPSPTISSYSVTRREVPWHKVPTVPRPSQVQLPMTAFGRRQPIQKGQAAPRTHSRFLFNYTPRHYVVTDTPQRPRRAEEQYSYSYSSTSESTKAGGPGGSSIPTRAYSSSNERVNRSVGSGPGNYNYSTERSSRAYGGDTPGGYHSSYSSTTSGRLPHGTSYRHYSYRV